MVIRARGTSDRLIALLQRVVLPIGKCGRRITAEMAAAAFLAKVRGFEQQNRGLQALAALPEPAQLLLLAATQAAALAWLQLQDRRQGKIKPELLTELLTLPEGLLQLPAAALHASRLPTPLAQSCDGFAARPLQSSRWCPLQRALLGALS